MFERVVQVGAIGVVAVATFGASPAGAIVEPVAEFTCLGNVATIVGADKLSDHSGEDACTAPVELGDPTSGCEAIL